LVLGIQRLDPCLHLTDVQNEGNKNMIILKKVFEGIQKHRMTNCVALRSSKCKSSLLGGATRWGDVGLFMHNAESALCSILLYGYKNNYVAMMGRKKVECWKRALYARSRIQHAAAYSLNYPGFQILVGLDYKKCVWCEFNPVIIMGQQQPIVCQTV